MTHLRRNLWFMVFTVALLTLSARAAAQNSEDEILVAGKPPLTKNLANKETRCVEWLLDVRLTPEQRGEFRDQLYRVWITHRKDDIDGYVNLVNLWDQIAEKSPEERDIVREGVRAKLLERERQTPNDRFAHWIVRVYDSAHPPIAAGNPPLNAQAADAYADMIAFIINDSLRRTALRPNRQFKDLVTRVLAAQYSGYSAEQQNAISQMPFLWKELRYVWPRLSESQRGVFRQQWSPMVASLTSGASGQAASASNGNNSSLDDFFARNSEHMSLQPMFHSSFNETMSLHLNMFNH